MQPRTFTNLVLFGLSCWCINSIHTKTSTSRKQLNQAKLKRLNYQKLRRNNIIKNKRLLKADGPLKKNLEKTSKNGAITAVFDPNKSTTKKGPRSKLLYQIKPASLHKLDQKNSGDLKSLNKRNCKKICIRPNNYSELSKQTLLRSLCNCDDFNHQNIDIIYEAGILPDDEIINADSLQAAPPVLDEVDSVVTHSNQQAEIPGRYFNNVIIEDFRNQLGSKSKHVENAEKKGETTEDFYVSSGAMRWSENRSYNSKTRKCRLIEHE